MKQPSKTESELGSRIIRFFIKNCSNECGMSQCHWQQAALLHFIAQPAAAGSPHP
jgi:hypothetical protein